MELLARITELESKSLDELTDDDRCLMLAISDRLTWLSDPTSEQVQACERVKVLIRADLDNLKQRRLANEIN